MIFLILVDGREPQHSIDNGIKRFGSENIKVSNLNTGDLLINGAVLERKRIDDLVSSVIDGRLHEQCIKMLAYPQRFLIIEGNFDKLRESHERYRKYHNKWYYGVLASISVKYGIQIIQVKDNVQFWTLVERLQYKLEEQKEITDSRIYTPKISRKNKSVFLSQLCCVPTISESKALKIQEKFPDNRALCDSTIEDLMSVKGVGKVLANRIKDSYY